MRHVVVMLTFTSHGCSGLLLTDSGVLSFFKEVESWSFACELRCINEVLSACGVECGLPADFCVHASQSEVNTRCELIFVIELHPLFEHGKRFGLQDRSEVKLTELILLDDAIGFFIFGPFTEGAIVTRLVCNSAQSYLRFVHLERVIIFLSLFHRTTVPSCTSESFLSPQFKDSLEHAKPLY